MIVLTVIVPSYNSEKYLEHCMETLLDSGEGMEILVVNDGSLDRTPEIAEEYTRKYPEKVKVIHQENSGHGGAVNKGILHAKGNYVKVVDSDDWVNPEVLKKVVAKLKEMIVEKNEVDMFLTNFMYDKLGVKKKHIMEYRDIIEKDRIIGWDEVGRFPAKKYILMHSVIYRTDLIRNSGLILPKHTFYVDNLFVYVPMALVNTMYYMDECLYHYFIGRDEQSVNEKNMLKRIDQQIRVNRLMLEYVELRSIKNKNKKKYMTHYLNLVTAVTSVILFRSEAKDAIQQKKELWEDIRKHDKQLFYRMRTSLVGSIINLPGASGKRTSLLVYKIAKKRVGFN